MKKARKRKMFIAIGMLLVFVGVLMIWFNISYSPLKRQFQNDIAALCGNYQISLNGIKYPTKFQAVWNYPEGDFVYFNGVVSEVSYGHEQ